MIIDFNQEGFLFDTFDSEGTSNAAQGNGGALAQVKDIREERPIYVPTHLERAELEKEIASLENIAINHCMFVKDVEELMGKTITGKRIKTK